MSSSPPPSRREADEEDDKVVFDPRTAKSEPGFGAERDIIHARAVRLHKRLQSFYHNSNYICARQDHIESFLIKLSQYFLALRQALLQGYAQLNVKIDVSMPPSYRPFPYERPPMESQPTLGLLSINYSSAELDYISAMIDHYSVQQDYFSAKLDRHFSYYAQYAEYLIDLRQWIIKDFAQRNIQVDLRMPPPFPPFHYAGSVEDDEETDEPSHYFSSDEDDEEADEPIYYAGSEEDDEETDEPSHYSGSMEDGEETNKLFHIACRL